MDVSSNCLHGVDWYLEEIQCVNEKTQMLLQLMIEGLSGKRA